MTLSRTRRRTAERATAEWVTAEWVIGRLEDAGRTLLALQVRGVRPGGYRSTMPETVQEFAEAYGWTDERPRAAVPSAADITRMDEALAWPGLIPADRTVLKRLVHARALVNPLTDRHLFSWRRLGAVVGADHKAVQRWHAQGIDLIVDGLRRGARPALAGMVVV